MKKLVSMFIAAAIFVPVFAFASAQSGADVCYNGDTIHVNGSSQAIQEYLDHHQGATLGACVVVTPPPPTPTPPPPPPVCPEGQVGTPPNCVPVEVQQCAENQHGTFPDCIDNEVTPPPAPPVLTIPPPQLGGTIPWCTSFMAPGWINGPGGTAETGLCSNGSHAPNYDSLHSVEGLYRQLIVLLGKWITLL